VAESLRWVDRATAEINKMVAYYKSTFYSIKISYDGSQKTKVEAEPNPDALERISLRFYDL
jgi:hypothetical protein